MVFCGVRNYAGILPEYGSNHSRNPVLRSLVRRNVCVEQKKRDRISWKNSTISAICSPGGNGKLAGIKKGRNRMVRKKGSMTVEAALVMGVVLFALMEGILWVWKEKDHVQGEMMLQEGLELLRYEEDHELWKEAEKGMKRLGYGIQIITEGERLEGKVEKGMWEQEISMKSHDPEDFLRKAAAIQEGTGNGGSVSEGSQP